MKVKVEVLKDNKAAGLKKGDKKQVDKSIAIILIENKVAKYVIKKTETKK